MSEVPGPATEQVSDTVLLVMDIQSMIASSAPPEMLKAVADAIAGARTARVPVVYVRVALRPGPAGVSPRNKRLTRLHAQLTEGAPGLEFHPAIAPQPDDIVLTKHRVSAFAGSGLDVLLRSLGTTHLVLTGVSTSTVVLMTAMTAADLDFTITVLCDGCFDIRPRVHDTLMSDVFPTMATVATVDDWLTGLLSR
ncbi:MAG: isochorismatase family cysteine hydrolase [Terracoccus sp.]